MTDQAVAAPQLTVGSVFTGIAGFDLGFWLAGFQTIWMCEREAWPRRVLARHFPKMSCHDDVLTLGEVERPDVLIGGFPCQDVSVAGRRKGLIGERSGLFFAFRDLVDRLKPRRGVVIENVPGLLSSHQGRDFHTVLAEMAELGFQPAYRVLDSRYFGVAQRRRRVFIVLCPRVAEGRARTVLFESESRPRRAQTGAQARADVSATLRGRSARRGVSEPGRGGEDDSNLVAIGVHANQRGELRTSPVAGSLSASKSGKQLEGVLAFDNRQAAAAAVASTLRSDCHGAQPMVLASSGERARALTASMHKRHDEDTDTLVANTPLAPSGGQRTDDLNQTFTPTLYGVRRLTPLECERVQGFPDGWTCLCGVSPYSTKACTCPDTPRYKALGNAVTVPVAQWIAERILEAERHVTHD